MLGKHFTVISFGEGSIPFKVKGRTLRRHFTIANCMRRKFYNELLRILKAENQSFAMEHSNVTFDISLLSSEDSNQINISCKNYGLEFGLSRRLHDAKLSRDTYMIKGPMGKGLGLNEDSVGNHFAFAAGTGILVFIDLVAKFALTQLDLIPEKDRLHHKFRFFLFASFQCEEEGIALELLKLVDRQAQMNQSENFTLKLRFSDKKSPRWDEAFLAKTLGSQ